LGDPRTTIHHAIAQALPAETIIVAGSIFLVGAVRAALLGLQQDTILPL
jgi:folylpolyglutamate synthase/dihydropteroate synthase